MILVDTSIWIRLFSRKPAFLLKEEELALMATCLPVVQEVLQGVRDDLAHKRLKERFLALPLLGNPLSLEIYCKASDIYRQGRKKGFTIRSSTDCLIASIALANSVSVWHADHDFDAIAKYTELEIFGGFQK